MFRSLLALIFASFSSAALAGQPLRLAEAEQVAQDSAVLFFWSVDCGTCFEDMRSLEPLAEQGVKIVAVNTDSATRAAQVMPRLRASGVDLPTVLDPTGDLARRFSTGGPASLVVTGLEGQTVFRSAGRVDGEVLAAAASLATPRAAPVIARR